MEGDICSWYSIWHNVISIHSLRMEGDAFECAMTAREYPISIHSLRMEGDATTFTVAPLYLSFQSTPSAWRETARY